MVRVFREIVKVLERFATEVMKGVALLPIPDLFILDLDSFNLGVM